MLHTPTRLTLRLRLRLLLLRLLLWLLRGRVTWFTKNFLEGQRWCLCEELEHLKEELAEVELAAPVGIVLPRGPIRDEVILDPVVLLDVVEQFYDSRIFRLIEVYVGWYDRILRGQQEFEADWSHLSLKLDWQFASEHDDVVLGLACKADGDDAGLDCIVSLQEGIHIVSKLLRELIV